MRDGVAVVVTEVAVAEVVWACLKRERRRPAARRLLALQIRDRPGYL